MKLMWSPLVDASAGRLAVRPKSSPWVSGQMLLVTVHHCNMACMPEVGWHVGIATTASLSVGLLLLFVHFAAVADDAWSRSSAIPASFVRASLTLYCCRDMFWTLDHLIFSNGMLRRRLSFDRQVQASTSFISKQRLSLPG